MCLIFPQQVCTTHVRSLFANLLMGLVVGSWGKSSHVNSMRSLILLSFFDDLKLVLFLQHSFPHQIINEFKIWTLNPYIWDLTWKIVFCYVILRNLFLNGQNQRGGLTKSDITFVPYDIFGWNLEFICRNELPISL